MLGLTFQLHGRQPHTSRKVETHTNTAATFNFSNILTMITSTTTSILGHTSKMSGTADISLVLVTARHYQIHSVILTTTIFIPLVSHHQLLRGHKNSSTRSKQRHRDYSNRSDIFQKVQKKGELVSLQFGFLVPLCLSLKISCNCFVLFVVSNVLRQIQNLVSEKKARNLVESKE